MCGICGLVDLGAGPVAEDELRPVNEALRLRGPDDEGFFVEARAGLGHRRLSIIDLTGGHQPMANEDGQVLTVVNGEIYNFVELRSRLEALGHRFQTRSDTEVLIHGYEAWGDDVVHELDGMFAFAVWDRRLRRLLLARDRFGKKPLCWFRAGGRFGFASTITALLRHPASPRAIDPVALARYLALEFVPAPSSIVSGIHKLEPGTRLTLDENGCVATERFWRLEVGAAPVRAPAEEVDEELRTLLMAAVKKRLVSDVPLGIFLSGGIDSSSVVAAGVAAGAGRLRTFSISFGDPSFDESGYAREVAARFGTDHVEERLDESELLAIVPRVGEILDEPMADSSIVPTYLLSRVARRHVTVALGGDGGDELFAGYPTYVAHRLAGLGAPLLRGPLLRLATGIAARLPVSHRNLSLDFKLKKTLAGIGFPDELRNYAWLGAFAPDELPALVGHAVDGTELWRDVAAAYREAPGATHLEKVLYQDVRLYLAHQILVKVDRASMANSLEVRAPLLDTAFAEYVARLPLDAKLRRLTGKAAFKRALAPWLPAHILHRPKKGFGMPVGRWLGGPLRDLSHDLLLGAGGLAGTGLFERPALARLLEEHQRGAVDHRKRLWCLIVFEMWRRAHAV
jgi:asparagine synthase (glutamine-hydrolysing)